MLRHIALVCLVLAVTAKEVEKRQAQYGAPTGSAPATGYGGGFGASGSSFSGFSGPSGPGLDASFNGVGSGFVGGKCRDQTKYILTWTKAVIPVTLYNTRTEYLPTTLYKYVTETLYYPQTVVQLETSTRAGGVEYQEETKIAYRTNTLVIPRVDTVTSTLLFTEDEHVTVIETDHLTARRTQQYPIEVTVTSVRRVPQVQTSVSTQYQTQYKTQYATNQYDVVQTEVANVPQLQYITNTVTQKRYQTVAVTRTQKRYHTVTKCEQQGYPAPPRQRY